MLALTRRVPSVFLSSASLIVNQGSIPLFLGGVRWIVEDRWAREPLHQAATKRRHCFTSPNALLRPLPPPTSTLFGQSSPMRKCQRALPLASLPRPLPSLPFPPCCAACYLILCSWRGAALAGRRTTCAGPSCACLLVGSVAWHGGAREERRDSGNLTTHCTQDCWRG